MEKTIQLIQGNTTDVELLKQFGTFKPEFAQFQQPDVYAFRDSNAARKFLGRDEFERRNKELSLGISKPFSAELLKKKNNERLIKNLAVWLSAVIATIWMIVLMEQWEISFAGILFFSVMPVLFDLGLGFVYLDNFTHPEYPVRTGQKWLSYLARDVSNQGYESLNLLKKHPVWTNVNLYPEVQRFDTEEFMDAFDKMVRLVDYEAEVTGKKFHECETYATLSVIVDLLEENLHVLREINLKKNSLKLGNGSVQPIVKMAAGQQIEAVTGVLRHNEALLQGPGTLHLEVEK